MSSQKKTDEFREIHMVILKTLIKNNCFSPKSVHIVTWWCADHLYYKKQRHLKIHEKKGNKASVQWIGNFSKRVTFSTKNFKFGKRVKKGMVSFQE